MRCHAPSAVSALEGNIDRHKEHAARIIQAIVVVWELLIPPLSR